MAANDERSNANNSLAAIIFAVFVVVCVIAFLAYRGGDVGHLPALVGNLGGGPLFGPIDSFVGLILAGCVFSAWWGLGHFVIRWFKMENLNLFSNAAICVSIGAAALSLIWFFLGLAGFYSTIIAWIVVFAAALSAVFGRGTSRTSNEAMTTTHWFLFALIAVPLLMTLVASLAPPIAKDTLLYHFAVPKAFVAQHSNAFLDGNIASYLALGTEMHYVWAMLLAGGESPRAAEAAAGAVGFLFFPLLLTAIYGWARELKISRTWALIATVIVATVPSAYHVASSGYIDIALALFVTLAIYGLTRWWKEQTAGWVILTAIFLGAALSIKLTSVFVIAAFALVVLIRAREANRNPVAIAPGSDTHSAGKIIVSGFAALLLAGVIASPWYVRTFASTGSPVFPFYMSIWPGKANGWDVERSNLFQGMNSQYGGENKGVADYLLAPWNLSVTAQPEIAEHFDGVLGVAFLFGLPLLVWGLWKFDLAVEPKIGAGIAGIMFLFWLFSSQQLRYLLPILPVLAISIVAAAQKISDSRRGLRQVLQYGFASAGVAGIMVTAAWFCQKAPLRVVLGGETRDQYLTRSLDYYPFYQTVNTETPADAKVWLINMRRDTYNISRSIFSDYLFEDWTLRRMLWESRSSQELKEKAAALGVQYILTRHDFLFDYDKSTLVDDKRPRAENEAKLRMARDLILDPARTVKADNKFSLVKVF